MIKFKIITSPDLEIQHEHTYNLDTITLGEKRSCNLRILDPQIKNNIIKLSIKDENLIVQNPENDNYYFSNDKKIKGKTKVKREDVLKIGSTEIKIIDFNKSESSKSFFDKYNDRLDSEPDLKELFDSFREELIVLEKK